MFRNALFLACAVLCVVMSSCGDVVEYNQEMQLEVDVDSIDRFISKNNLIFTRDRTGLYSQILQTGGGDYEIEADDDILVNYTGKMLNGVIVERGDSVKLKYSGLIEGWRVGLPQIKPGGSIRLLIPSALAYTDKQVGLIPPNSNLDYVIVLRAIYRKGQLLPGTMPNDPDGDPATNDGGGVTLEPDY